jgi:magnesium transporter
MLNCTSKVKKEVEVSDSMFYHIPKEGKLIPVKSSGAALDAVKVGGFIWLHYCNPEREELTGLIETLGLHPLPIEDCFDDNQIPKIEDFPGNTFILFNSFEYSSQKLTVGEIDLFIGENFLVTVTQLNSENRPYLDKIEQFVEQNMENAKHGPAFLMHIILDHIVDRKFLAIEALEDQLDTIEESILTNLSNFEAIELMRLRRDLLSLRKSLFHEREILVKICRKDCPYISAKAIFHYRDIYDHLSKFFELTESYRDVVTSLMEMHLSMQNNQMAVASNKTNISVRRLTFITTIFMPLTLLAGIGGMSEWSMMTGPQNWKIAYPAFVIAMVVIGFANYYLLKMFEKKS